MTHPPTFEPETAEQSAALHAAFLADFANGRIGQHHNLYQHRARLVRQSLARQKGQRPIATNRLGSDPARVAE